MQIEWFSVVLECHNFIGPGAGFTRISKQVHYRVIPNRVPPIATSFTIYTDVFHELTPRTKLLHADEFRHICFCRVRIPLNLGGLKIIKYISTLFALASKTSLSGLIKHRFPTSLFLLQISQYRLLHSWFPRVTRAPHVSQHYLLSQRDL